MVDTNAFYNGLYKDMKDRWQHIRVAVPVFSEVDVNMYYVSMSVRTRAAALIRGSLKFDIRIVDITTAITNVRSVLRAQSTVATQTNQIISGLRAYTKPNLIADSLASLVNPNLMRLEFQILQDNLTPMDLHAILIYQAIFSPTQISVHSRVNINNMIAYWLISDCRQDAAVPPVFQEYQERHVMFAYN